jgi:two-component system, response regulator PdtaR
MSIQPVTKRILVCEDSDTIARLWGAALEHSGYQVVGPVSSAEKALEEAYQHLPDLAIIDIGLSGEIDGISAEGWQIAADILIKPVLPSTVIKSVNSILQRKATVE